MIKLTGLWKNKSKNGMEYLSGRLGNAKVMIFPVKNKKSDKSPDYELVLAEYEHKENNSNNELSSGQVAAQKSLEASQPTFSDADIPF